MANNSDQNIRRNLMLVIFIITILFSIIIILHQNNLIKENFKNEMSTFDENVHRAFNVILDNLSHDMSMRSSGILGKKGLIKTFFDKDRDKLEDIVIPFYRRMSEQNPYFKIMTFSEHLQEINLGIKTIAEFVSKKEIFDIVHKLGVDEFQGYYFSEPLDIKNI